MQRTLIIAKPDAMERGKASEILEAFCRDDFRMVDSRELHLSVDQAEGFYAEHVGKPFFANLVAFMTSGPCLVACLEREDAIPRARLLVGATDPSKANTGTIRRRFGSSTTKNAVHASDSEKSARREIGFFFPDLVPSTDLSKSGVGSGE